MTVTSVSSSKATYRAPTAELFEGSRGPAVEALQKDLVKLGFMSAADMKTGPGHFGPHTKAALKKFQAHHGLAADGQYGPKSRAALEKALGQAPKASTTTPPKTSTGKADKPVSSSFPKVPRGRSGIEATFGKPGAHQTTVALPLGPGGKTVNVRCHEKIAPVMKAMLAEAKAKGLLKYIHTYDGMYCYRTKNHKPGAPLSVHSWGIAFDINASEGSRGKVNPELAKVFEKYGFYWGKNFNDEMHFQYARGY